MKYRQTNAHCNHCSTTRPGRSKRNRATLTLFFMTQEQSSAFPSLISIAVFVEHPIALYQALGKSAWLISCKRGHCSVCGHYDTENMNIGISHFSKKKKKKEISKHPLEVILSRGYSVIKREIIVMPPMRLDFHLNRKAHPVSSFALANRWSWKSCSLERGAVAIPTAASDRGIKMVRCKSALI